MLTTLGPNRRGLPVGVTNINPDPNSTRNIENSDKWKVTVKTPRAFGVDVISLPAQPCGGKQLDTRSSVN
jgi:hypothetical protein